MKIVVCIKQVPGTHEVSIDPETKRLKREGVAAVMNPFDAYALEQAVQLKEERGAEVVALSMGPKKAADALREAIALGADSAVLLNSRAFAGSDTWATSYALAMAVKALGEVDMVFCGKQATDGDTAQVGPGIAAHLDWPQATNCSAMDDVTDTTVAVTRMHEDGFDRCELDLPAVLTVVKDINQPRVPTLRGVLAARETEITTWTETEIEANPELLGLDGSPTRVVKTRPPAARDGETLVIEGEPADSARRLVHELRVRSLV